MKAKLEGQDDWSTMNKLHELVALLKSIKVWMLNQQSDQNPVLSTYHSIATVFRLRQQRHVEIPEFRKRFVASIDVLEHNGVTFGGALVKIADGILRDELKKSDTGYR